MKLAIIPPVARLSDIQYREYHLLLPQLLDNYVQYETYYMYMPKKKSRRDHSTCDKFYILDNGAAEGEPFGLGELQEMAVDHGGIDEIVLPDKMGDGETTQEFLDSVKPELLPSWGYMYVAHGQSAWEVLNRAAYALQHPLVTTIGLPRCLFDTIEKNDYGIRLRCKLAEEIKETVYHRDFNVHLLGAHPLWYQEAQDAASSKYIRSMDTSLPYVIASHGHMMSGTTPQGLTRKEGYFDWEPSNREDSNAHFNVQLMDRWVEDGNERRSQTA